MKLRAFMPSMVSLHAREGAARREGKPGREREGG